MFLDLLFIRMSECTDDHDVYPLIKVLSTSELVISDFVQLNTLDMSKLL